MKKILNIALIVTLLIVIGCSDLTDHESGSNAPSNLVATYYLNTVDSMLTVDLVWDAPEEPDYDNFEYRIYKDDQFIIHLSNMQNYYTDIDCEIGGEYAYYITAYYPTGESDPSNVENVIIYTVPNPPSNPFPANNANFSYEGIELNWSCEDPDGDTLTYDVHFGTEEDPPLVVVGQSSTTYYLGTLSELTRYYWKIVANDNHSNSTTGDVWNFTSTGSVTDNDGNVYQTLVIGNQEWMIENLKVTHYRNGDSILNVTDNSDWASLSTGSYCVYGNDPSNADTYGNLYNWYAIDDSRNITPEGWHVPTDEEIMELEMYMGMSENEANGTGYRGTNEGSKLAGDYDLWDNGNLKNNPEFGSSDFSFIPGGYRYDNGIFSFMGLRGYLWSSSEVDANAWRRALTYNNPSVHRGSDSDRYGFSVRCVSD